MPRFDIQLAIHIHERRHQMGMIREIKVYSEVTHFDKKELKHQDSPHRPRTYASQSEVGAANGLKLATTASQMHHVVFSKTQLVKQKDPQASII